jgi:hypothetical protein
MNLDSLHFYVYNIVVIRGFIMRRATNRPYNDEWDGVDRRNDDNDRRFEPRYYPVQQPADDHNASTLQMTLKEWGGVSAFVLGILFTIGSAWNNISRDIDTQELVFSQFKEQLTKQVEEINMHIVEIKNANEKIHDVDRKDLVALELHVQELEGSVNQLYQKLREKK